MQHILMIEGDGKIAALTGRQLEEAGYTTEYATDAASGLALAHSRQYDLIVLDLELADMPGAEALARLKREKPGTPLLVLVTRQEDIGTDPAGCCDYLLKPFSIGGFLSRAKALLRSTTIQREEQGRPMEMIIRGPLVLDKERRQVTLDGTLLDLGYKEFDLLQVLMSHPGRSFPAEQLLKEVWGPGFAGFEHTLTTCLAHLRARIEPDPLNPRFILTTWGVGYRFTDEY